MQTVIQATIFVHESSRKPISEGLTELIKLLGRIESSLMQPTNERVVTLNTSVLTPDVRIEFSIEQQTGTHPHNFYCLYCGKWSIRLETDCPTCCPEAGTVWRGIFGDRESLPSDATHRPAEHENRLQSDDSPTQIRTGMENPNA